MQTLVAEGSLLLGPSWALGIDGRGKKALSRMNPLCTLRYSATHVDKHNMVYRLDAVDAYEQKLVKKIVVVLYGTTFWKEVLNFDALLKHGMISPEDLDLYQYADDVDSAFKILESGLTKYYLEPDKETPAIAKSRV